jgi:pimeloyl-ACP methyl ester carboxylesterase/streptogramin lyase
MNDLLQRFDPAAGAVIDSESLRSRVDERLGLAGTVLPVAVRVRRPWLAAAAAFAVVLAVFVPVTLNRQGETTENFAFDQAVSQIPGVESVLHESAGGGVRTFAVDGETLWVTSALARKLTRINVAANVVEESYPIDAYVEGVKIGGGYLWLLSYDNGGEVLRFDPIAGVVDLAIPLGASPGGVQWYADRLWAGNAAGQLFQISVDGVIESTTRGELVGMAFGSLWVIDPETRMLRDYTAEGPGSVAIPTEGMLVGQVIEAGGYLWVLERDLSIVGTVHRYDPDGGAPISVRVGYGAHSMVELDGSLWIASLWDETVTRIDTATSEVLTVTPLPGRTGAIAAADGSLWVSFYQPGLLIRFDPAADLMSIGEVVVDEVVDGYRLLCTGGGNGPTILLDPEWWIGPGSWSVIQAQLSSDALVCSHGAVDDRDAAAKVDNLLRVLEEFNVDGPYLLVAHGTGVVSTRLLAEQAIDVAGVVLVEPVPTGFFELMQSVLPQGAPVTFELDDPDPLGDLGDIPLVVIGDDQSATFLNDSFDDNTGADPGTGALLAQAWADGLAFYAGLSTDSRSITISGSSHMVIWDRPETVVDGVLDLLGVVDAP